jgi:thioredoxin reductase
LLCPSGMTESYEVVIIGGGPAGLSAALMLGRCRRKIIVLDSAQPRNAAARVFHGYLGRDGTEPRALMEAARQEVQHYGAEICSETAVRAERLPVEPRSAFLIETSTGRTLQCRKLLLATGLRDCLPDLPGVKECYGISVHHCPYCDGWEHRDQHLLAYGNTASAARGLARLLTNWSSRVTVLTDGQPPESVELTAQDRARLAFRPEPVEALLHTSGKLHAAVFKSGEQLAADALFFNVGQEPHCDLPRKLGCSFAKDAIARSQRKQRTNVPGLFLAGDVDGDVQFVAVAAAEGATAAVAINRELQEEDWRE